jgi:Protein of unknown function (DUF992)
MPKTFAAVVAIAALLVAAEPLTAQQPTYTRFGTLTCNLSPGIGLVVGSRQTMGCRFQPDSGPPQDYEGVTTTFGLDVGVTAGGVLIWGVLLSTDAYPGALSGNYVGASGEASFGAGVGANVLIGGSNRTVALQPLSVEGQIGINLALGVTGMELRYVR